MASTIDNTTGIGILFGALDTTSLRSNAAITALQSGITLMQSKKYKEAAGQFKIAAAYRYSWPTFIFQTSDPLMQ